MITGPDRNKLKNLMHEYARMSRRCFRNAELALEEEGELEHKLFHYAGFMHFNIAREIEAILKPDQIAGLRNDDFLQAHFKNFKRP